MNLPLVTVIIPFYNEELRLMNAVKSVLNQNYSNIEIILINDGSTDTSQKIAGTICKENKFCTLVSIANKGPGNARNIGLEKANGKYVAFLDADDELETWAIDILVKNIITEKTDLSIAMYTMIDAKNQFVKSSSWNNENVIDANKAILYVITNKLIPTVWGKLFKTKFAKQCKFPVKSWKEDDVFILQYLKLTLKISVINNSILKINCRNNSLTRQVVSLKMIDDCSYSYKEQLKLIAPNVILEKELVISYLHTLLNLFLSLKIDWNRVEHKIEVLRKFENEVDALKSRSKKYTISFKQKVLFVLLKLNKLIGWKIPFLIISVLKKEQLKSLKKIKS